MTQRASRFTLWAAVTVLLALPALAQSSDLADDRIPINDPELLEGLGYAPGTPNIYATPEVYERMLMSPAELAAASRLDAEVGEAQVDTGSSSVFGQTAGTSSIFGTDFAPLDADTDYTLLGSGTQIGRAHV